MRASVIVAAHNEGDRVAQTIETCLSTTEALDPEIVIVDDASTDGAAGDAAHRYPRIELVRHERRAGASGAKATGAGRARGDVLVFLDGHTKAEPGAIERLVRGVEELDGSAILTPAVAALDVTRWTNDHSVMGHGYRFELRRFECEWLPVGQLHRYDGRAYYESPGLIGCAFAVSRNLYFQLRGFDAHMRSWGVEDLDLALKAWLTGARVLHDPEAIVGHHFRAKFDNYAVPAQDVLVNQLRMARKHFTHSVWEQWVSAMRSHTEGQVNGHPEGVWAEAWHLFEQDRASVEDERAYLLARRARDEFWYAHRFGLAWPTLSVAATAAGSPATAAAPQPGATSHASAVHLVPAAGVHPSPSPPPSRFTVNGPADVPGLAQYQYAIALPAGKTAANIQWQADKPTATFKGAIDKPTVTVAFAAGTADWVTLRATFTLDGHAESASIQIAVVRVQVGTRTFANPGLPNGAAGPATSLLVNPPAPPATPTWVTRHTPGSAVAAFTYNGTQQAAEPTNVVRSNGATAGTDAFTAQTTVKLTAPPEKPLALQRIQVGFVQAGLQSGSANYPSTPPVVRHRTVTMHTASTVDWLSNPRAATDDWPWYDETARDTGSGTTGTWARSLSMGDSPAKFLPQQCNPNNPADPDATKAITAGTATIAFQTRIAARTLDTALGANGLYFDHGHSSWNVALAWPVVAGVSDVAFPAQNWIVPTSPTALDVNVVPTITAITSPFLQWTTAKFIDRTPDVSADDFWDAHEVLVVRVTSVSGDPAGAGVLHTEVLRRLNSTGTAGERDVAVRDLAFVPDPTARDRVASGDELVLYIGPELPIVAEPVDGSIDASPLVRRLTDIASLRLGEGGRTALHAAAAHPDPLVARYSLKRQIAANPSLSDDQLGDLQEVRDDPNADPEVRMLSEQRLLQHAGESWDGDQAVAWLHEAIEAPAAADWTTRAPFVRRLAEIDSHRDETVSFLVGLATDESAKEAVRIAAYSGFEQLIGDVGEPQVDQIVQACFTMLASGDPTVRRAGASLLANFSIRGGTGPLQGLGERASQAITAARDDESDAQVREHLDAVGERLSSHRA
jgi:glycosyltransferase involved in cell wall biosynthesis